MRETGLHWRDVNSDVQDYVCCDKFEGIHKEHNSDEHLEPWVFDWRVEDLLFEIVGADDFREELEGQWGEHPYWLVDSWVLEWESTVDWGGVEHPWWLWSSLTDLRDVQGSPIGGEVGTLFPTNDLHQRIPSGRQYQVLELPTPQTEVRQHQCHANQLSAAHTQVL